MDWVTNITNYITTLVENRVALAIFIGLVFSLALTQWIKFVLLRTKWLPDPKVWIIHVLAMPVGAIPAIMVLPSKIELTVRVLIGISVGAAAPYVYKIITAVLYKIWPDLEKRLSVDPYTDKTDGPPQ